MSATRLIRADLQSIKPYVPSEEELDCRLQANELPWAPASYEALALNRYPDAKRQKHLQEILADAFQVQPEQMLLTRGSDDAIDLLFRSFLQPGVDSLMQCPPTFSMYAFYARLQQVKLMNCPLDPKKGFHLSIDQLMSAWQPGCKLIMLCRPNNPTGHLLDLATIASLCRQLSHQAVVVVDEAYIDFAEAPSATTLLASCENLLVLRTLSKAYGLAGLRLGAVIAQEEVICALQPLMAPYTLPSVVIEVARQALADQSWFKKRIQWVVKERGKLVRAFEQFPWLSKVYPSSANFILVASEHAALLRNWLAEQGIAVRHFSEAGLQGMLRITVGAEPENRRLLTVLNSFKV